MKTVTASRLASRAAWLLGAALIFAHQAAQACPGCKQNLVAGPDGKIPEMTGASVGLSLGVLFMIFMVMAILGWLGFVMYRACQALAARQNAELARMEAEEAALPGLPSPA